MHYQTLKEWAIWGAKQLHIIILDIIYSNLQYMRIVLRPGALNHNDVIKIYNHEKFSLKIDISFQEEMRYVY